MQAQQKGVDDAREPREEIKNPKRGGSVASSPDLGNLAEEDCVHRAMPTWRSRKVFITEDMRKGK